LALRHTLEWGLVLAALAADAGPAAADTVRDGERAYVHRHFEEARRIWTPLAEAGDAEAQVSLGLLFDLGQGVPEDPATAYKWYRRAAEAGLAKAQFNVAVMEDSGVVGPRDAVAAARWYAKASSPWASSRSVQPSPTLFLGGWCAARYRRGKSLVPRRGPRRADCCSG
jgi:uncharacterized protein